VPRSVANAKQPANQVCQRCFSIEDFGSITNGSGGPQRGPSQWCEPNLGAVRWTLPEWIRRMPPPAHCTVHGSAPSFAHSSLAYRARAHIPLAATASRRNSQRKRIITQRVAPHIDAPRRNVAWRVGWARGCGERWRGQ
jgi:hypothetical protein